MGLVMMVWGLIPMACRHMPPPSPTPHSSTWVVPVEEDAEVQSRWQSRCVEIDIVEVCERTTYNFFPNYIFQGMSAASHLYSQKAFYSGESVYEWSVVHRHGCGS